MVWPYPNSVDLFVSKGLDMKNVAKEIRKLCAGARDKTWFSDRQG